MDSLNYESFIPHVNTLQFHKVDTLYNFLQFVQRQKSSLPDEDNKEVAIDAALKALKTELGIVGSPTNIRSTNYFIDSSSGIDNELLSSPSIRKKKEQFSDFEDLYRKNKEQISNAVSEIVNHREVDKLFYTLSVRTAPDPKPTRLIQDEVRYI